MPDQSLHASLTLPVDEDKLNAQIPTIQSNENIHLMPRGKNVLGGELLTCSTDPMTGWFRDGCCGTGPGDMGMHVICCRVTDEFLEFSKKSGNDLSTPMPEYRFPGLKAGDQWCVCAARWKEAYDAGKACQVVLEATHMSALEFASLEELSEHAVQE